MVSDFIDLYHITKVVNVPSILRQGLIVGHKYAEGPFCDFAQDNSSIWFFTYKDEAIRFVRGETGWAMLVVRIPKSLVHEWKEGGVGENWKFIYSNISPKDIVKVVYLK